MLGAISARANPSRNPFLCIQFLGPRNWPGEWGFLVPANEFGEIGQKARTQNAEAVFVEKGGAFEALHRLQVMEGVGEVKNVSVGAIGHGGVGG
ncbi:hypothetical protein L3X38_042285 [Prunus dulcis]|uniref:Uncharacterized protein n=1 Tax=Prunus dulcis TaxID=3755 RepID=A0AAD4UWB1_PRUDU|nr:hypothetical protein L3X38_042285 [Prunus dulcis]